MSDEKCVFLAKRKTKRKHVALVLEVTLQIGANTLLGTSDRCVGQAQNSYLQYDAVDFIIFPKFELLKNRLSMELANFDTYIYIYTLMLVYMII